MTNADKYLKDGVDVMQMLHDYNQTGQKCPSVWKWLEQSIKPTLSEDEKVILRNIDKRYKFIARFENNLRLLSTSKEHSFVWTTISGFNHLFQFIQPRRRI